MAGGQETSAVARLPFWTVNYFRALSEARGCHMILKPQAMHHAHRFPAIDARESGGAIVIHHERSARQFGLVGQRSGGACVLARERSILTQQHNCCKPELPGSSTTTTVIVYRFPLVGGCSSGRVLFWAGALPGAA